MKALLRYFWLVCLVALATSCGTSRQGARSSAADRLIGLWEVKAVHNSDEPGFKEMPKGMFKMIFPNGQFMNFMSTKDGAIITVNGTYRLAGNVYTEEIVHSFNRSQIGIDNPLNLMLSGEHFMRLRWFQPIDEFGERQDRWIEEIWQRVQIKDLEVSGHDLRSELRTILRDEEAIKKVID